MGLIGLFVGLGLFCALLWYCAIYALPVFVGISIAWWALNHNFGVACIPLGLFAGVALFVVGRTAATSASLALRWAVFATFVLPAFLAGFGIAGELIGRGTVPHVLICTLAGFAAGAVAFNKLALSSQVPQL